MCQCTLLDGNRSSLQTASFFLVLLKMLWLLPDLMRCCDSVGTSPSADCYRYEPSFYQCTGVIPQPGCVFRGQSVQSQTFSLIRLFYFSHLPSGVTVREFCRHCIVTDFICTVCVSFSCAAKRKSKSVVWKMKFFSRIPLAKSIISLGIRFPSCMPTNSSPVSICCNHVLPSPVAMCTSLSWQFVLRVSLDGGNSDLCDHEGSSPIMLTMVPLRPLSRQPIKSRHHDGSYGARLYWSCGAWSFSSPEYLISVFKPGYALSADAVPCIKTVFCCIYLYGSAYRSDCFQIFKQTETGDLLFRCARCLSLYCWPILPYTFHMERIAYFFAEPVSNVIGGCLCFIINVVYGSAGAEPDGNQ